MKKSWLLPLAATLTLALAACSDSSTEETTDTTDTSVEETATEQQQDRKSVV